MTTILIRDFLLGIAAVPFIYFALALVSTLRFFLAAPAESEAETGFQPPISNLKPVRGLDPNAYENFASFCRQDYPNYEILFCIGDTSDPAYPVLQQLVQDFPECQIRILIGSGRKAVNDKVAKLARLTDEASYEYLVISDSDVRVEPDYLRKVISPLADSKVGAVTCFYVPTEEKKNWLDQLQEVGMLSDFYPGLLVAEQLDGVKFALGPTIVTTRTRLKAFGGYASIENLPADDLLVGRKIAEQGYEVKLLPYSISTVPDFGSFSDLVHKRLRWMTVMRHMRPWGHLGLIFTLGLPWTLLAVAIRPTPAIAAVYVGGYLLFRSALTALVGAWGLKQRGVWRKLAFIPLWDAFASFIWLTSFTRSTIRWRGQDYMIRNGELVPAVPELIGHEAKSSAVSSGSTIV
jgi:ceramide glucosyltransferase